ncbi:hypothetical protein KI387_012907, partial [Taxus chinensis]
MTQDPLEPHLIEIEEIEPNVDLEDPNEWPTQIKWMNEECLFFRHRIQIEKGAGSNQTLVFWFPKNNRSIHYEEIENYVQVVPPPQDKGQDLWLFALYHLSYR